MNLNVHKEVSNMSYTLLQCVQFQFLTVKSYSLPSQGRGIVYETERMKGECSTFRSG